MAGLQIKHACSGPARVLTATVVSAAWLCWPAPSLAHRPFDGTDASVADVGIGDGISARGCYSSATQSRCGRQSDAIGGSAGDLNFWVARDLRGRAQNAYDLLLLILYRKKPLIEDI